MFSATPSSANQSANAAPPALAARPWRSVHRGRTAAPFRAWQSGRSGDSARTRALLAPHGQLRPGHSSTSTCQNSRHYKPHRNPRLVALTTCNPFISAPCLCQNRTQSGRIVLGRLLVLSHQSNTLGLTFASNIPTPETAPLVYSWLAKLASQSGSPVRAIANDCPAFTRGRVNMGALLETIHSPADLKRLNPAQMTELAEEIRAFLIQTLSKTGGHLGPNLGVVELTLALHTVFDTPDRPHPFRRQPPGLHPQDSYRPTRSVLRRSASPAD